MTSLYFNRSCRHIGISVHFELAKITFGTHFALFLCSLRFANPTLLQALRRRYFATCISDSTTLYGR